MNLWIELFFFFLISPWIKFRSRRFVLDSCPPKRYGFINSSPLRSNLRPTTTTIKQSMFILLEKGS
ncbi:unnamed protein product [Brassica oleracea]